MTVERDDNPHFAATLETLARWKADPSQEPKVEHTFECHIFCAPLAPSDEEKERFADACEALGLRGLCLGLDFDGKGVIDVLQSSKYTTSADVHTSVEVMLEDARRLNAHFEVIRLKLEAIAADPGVPRTDEEAAAMPGDTYFEYHLKVQGEVSAENDARLKALAQELSAAFDTKIPFSCNNLRGKDQRFLNARTYGMGSERSSAVVDQLVEAIEGRGFEVGKIIREFIVFDTNKGLDRGWVEP